MPSKPSSQAYLKIPKQRERIAEKVTLKEVPGRYPLAVR